MKKTHEKDVTLAIAKEIKSQMDKEPGLTAVLTRTGDYFIPLPDRRRLARYQHKADIFVSIHADAAENRSAKGASVFALSLKGAGTATSRFAQMLAERENRSDLIGGAIEKDDDVLRNVLADMVVAGSLEHSLHMGRFILNGLDEIGSLHSKHVEQAGFAVLKEPGMVSLLVETGFISNPEEEKKLIDTDYQQKIAQSVLSGIRRYAQKYPSPGTYFAWQAEQGRSDGVSNNTTANKVVAAALPNVAPLVESQKQEPVKPSDKAVVKKVTIKHKVVRGENLTKLAAQYQVSLSALRDLNNLQDDNVKIGQVLKIPTN
jgi:N-acetylmuramoyl-L-alanine amidase